MAAPWIMDGPLAHLIVLEIGVGLVSLGGIMAALISLAKQLGETRASTARIAESTECIAEMTREVLRRMS